MSLDLHTLILLNLIGNFVNLVAVWIIWTQFGRRYAGLSWWLADMVLQVLGIGLILLRGVIPDFASIVLANVAVQLGTFFLLLGLGKFVGKSVSLGPNYAVLVLFFLGFLYLGLVQPDLNSRDIVLSATMSLFMAQAAWLLLYQAPVELRAATRMTAVLLISFVVVNILRILQLVIFPSRTSDYFQAGVLEGVALQVYVMLSFLLVMSLVLLVSRRLLSEVQAQEEKFSKAFYSAPYAVLLTRVADGKIFEVNTGFEEMTGFRRSEVMHKTTPELQIWTSEDTRSAFVRTLTKVGRVRNVEQVFRRKSGEEMVGLISAELIQIGQEHCVISSIADITEQSRLREQLEQAATHDALTGLPNRRLFSDRFGVAVANAARSGKKLAVISLDLDHFKEVNDTWGHDVGDIVLIEASLRLTACLRGIDTVSRFGGDEFVLLLWEVEEPDDAARIATKVLEQFHLPFEKDGWELIMNASMGIALYPDDGQDLKTLLKKSDEALYAAKETGRNTYRFTAASGPKDKS